MKEWKPRENVQSLPTVPVSLNLSLNTWVGSAMLRPGVTTAMILYNQSLPLLNLARVRDPVAIPGAPASQEAEAVEIAETQK